jgi:hypothetical protein
MGMDAVALLRISHATLTKPLTAHGDPKHHVFFAANGVPVRITPLDDGALVWTPIRFASEPDELALGVRALVGDTLDAHDDKRGVYVFPDVASPKARGYDAVIDEVGEVGMWVPKVAKDYIPRRVVEAPAGSLEAQVRDMMSAIPPDVLARMEEAMASGDLSALEQVRAQVEAAMGGEAGLARLREQFAAALAQQGLSLEDLQQQMMSAFGGDEGDMMTAMRQAQEQLEELRRTDPEKFAEIERQMREQLGKK